MTFILPYQNGNTIAVSEIGSYLVAQETYSKYITRQLKYSSV